MKIKSDYKHEETWFTNYTPEIQCNKWNKGNINQ